MKKAENFTTAFQVWGEKSYLLSGRSVSNIHTSARIRCDVCSDNLVTFIANAEVQMRIQKDTGTLN